MLSATVDIIATMGSYRGLVHFLNRLRTRMKSFFASSESASMHRNRYIYRQYETTGFANSHSDKCKNIELEEQWALERKTNKSRYSGGSRIDCRGGLSIPRALARAKFFATPTFGPFTNDVRPARSTHQKARFARDNNNYY